MSKKFPRNLIMSEDYRSDFEPMNLVNGRMKFLGWYEDEDKTMFITYMGKRLFRRYDNSTLPDILKIKLAVIGTYQMHDTPPDESLQQVYWTIKPPHALEDVGFSTDRGSYYVFIVTYLEFMELLGDVIKNPDNVRREEV